MINPKIVEVVAGSTVKLTWVSSGATASPIVSALIDKTDTAVSSVTATSSGNGHYYALHTMPDSSQWFVNRWFATVNANTYVSQQLVKAERLRVNSL